MSLRKRIHVEATEPVIDHDTWNYSLPKLPRASAISLSEIPGVLPFGGVRNPSARSNTSHKVFLTYRTPANDWAPKVGIAESAAEMAVGLQAVMSPNTFDVAFQPRAVEYRGEERPHIERLFWTLENIVFRMLPGYTGSRPGELPGYDATANGVLTVEEVHEIVTRYFIDEYPSTRHYGFGMNGRRPIDVYREINETRGHIPQIDPQTRLIQLGWEDEVTPTDEGVRVFHGIWFDSDEFQQKREEYHVTGKVKVYVDPDNLNLATAVLPNVKDPIELHLQVTAFADMTLPEVLRLMAEHRREEPNATEFHDDQVMHTRAHRYDRVKAIGVERNLPCSYSTIDECKRMAKSVLAGARMIRSVPVAGTTRPGQITNLEPSNVVYRFGGQTTPVPAAAIGPARLDALPGNASPITHTGVAAGSDESKPGSKPTKIRRKIPSPEEPSVSDQKFSRPTNLKGLE